MRSFDGRSLFLSRAARTSSTLLLIGSAVFLVQTETHANTTMLAGAADHRVGANSINSGTDGTCIGTSFISPTGNFTPNDVHKVFVVTGDTNSMVGGVNRANSILPDGGYPPVNRPLITTVGSYESATRITLDAGCENDITGSAQWDIGGDRSVELQNCVNTGDCTIPSGNYLLRTGVQLTHDGGGVHCEPGAVLFFPLHDSESDGGLPSALHLSDVSGVTVEHCTFVGTNLHQSYDLAENNHFIQIQGSARNNVISDNIFSNGWGSGDITIQAANGPSACGASPLSGDDVPGIPSGNHIVGNKLADCGFNGIALIAGNGNRFERNVLTNCNFDIEPNDPCKDGPVFSNTVTGNVVTATPGLRSPAVTDDAEHGYHWAVSFSGCGKVVHDDDGGVSFPCDGAGAATIDVEDNVLQGLLYVYPHCVNGSIAQTWTNNATLAPDGGTCTPGSAGCAIFSGCSPPPPPTESTDLPQLIFAEDGGVAGILVF